MSKYHIPHHRGTSSSSDLNAQTKLSMSLDEIVKRSKDPKKPHIVQQNHTHKSTEPIIVAKKVSSNTSGKPLYVPIGAANRSPNQQPKGASRREHELHPKSTKIIKTRAQPARVVRESNTTKNYILVYSSGKKDRSSYAKEPPERLQTYANKSGTMRTDDRQDRRTYTAIQSDRSQPSQKAIHQTVPTHGNGFGNRGFSHSTNSVQRAANNQHLLSSDIVMSIPQKTYNAPNNNMYILPPNLPDHSVLRSAAVPITGSTLDQALPSVSYLSHSGSQNPRAPYASEPRSVTARNGFVQSHSGIIECSIKHQGNAVQYVALNKGPWAQNNDISQSTAIYSGHQQSKPSFQLFNDNMGRSHVTPMVRY